ncbi:hypothetical protein VMCG_05495 [Cytospora schulzeri]|uniref:Carboxylesterase type B domain-containing protein n=1 Tax=Cytospora schulzeri TaxID=448051 RepID=A0A423WKB8_9PEZI|nr:hypothetical protein VMCG_05495 [Valsa malicola]
MAATQDKQDSSPEEHNPLRPKARIPTPHSGPSATVSLAQGRYVGVLLPAGPLIPRAVEAWRGIPYAETTGGANRFRPPVPLSSRPSLSATGEGEKEEEEEKTTFRADTWGAMCPGSAARVPGMLDGEDCLNLNVYRQAGGSHDPGARDGKMPVVIYVHGGAFNGGAGTERDMASFVGWSETPIVGVNFNYRVGALGFPSSGVAEGEGVLNLGLRDQALLFDWVRENVGGFGGDRDRVTLIGLSAGAHSVGYHLQSYTNTNTTAPFHRAIMESGGATARVTLSPTHPRTEGQFKEFLVACGIQPDQTPANQIFPLLRSLPLETILSASSAIFAQYQDPIRWPFQPVIDHHNPAPEGEEEQEGNGRLISDLPINTFRRGNHLRVPVLAGFNTNEGTAFTSPKVETNDDLLGKFIALVPGLNTSDLQQLSTIYPDPAVYPSSPYARVPPGFGRQWARYEAAYAHYAYICPVLQTGHFYSSSSGSDGDGDTPPVWIYHFAALARPDLGGKANHVDEAAVVAHDMAAIGAFPGLVRTADAMHGAWTRFIATGDPNPPHIDTAAAGAEAEAEAGENKEEEQQQQRQQQQQQQQQQEDSASPYPPSSSSPSSTGDTMPFWPRFSSPFVGDTATSPGRLRRKAGPGAEASGRVMMFGLGNDERMGGAGRRTPGWPATVVRLTEGEVERCRFWWERVELKGNGGIPWLEGTQ